MQKIVENGVELAVFHQESVMAQRRGYLAVHCPGNAPRYLALLGGGENYIGREATTIVGQQIRLSAASTPPRPRPTS